MSNRTGTSKAKPAVTNAPGAGGVEKVTTPVVASHAAPAPSGISESPTATRTLPATGFRIGRP